MSPDRMSATSVAHKSTGGTLQSLPEPVDPVGDAPDYLTFKTVAPLHHPVRQFWYLPENSRKSERVRAICDCAWTRRAAPAALIGGTRQNLSGLDSAGSTDVRSHFGSSIEPKLLATREAISAARSRKAN